MATKAKKLSDDDYIKNIKYAVDDIMSNNVLIPKDHLMGTLVKACSALLESQGCMVRNRPAVAGIVTNNKSLIQHYYSGLQFFFPNLIPIIDEIKDETIAKQFVGTMMRNYSLNHKDALVMCSRIQSVVLRQNDKFNFTENIFQSYSIFGQAEMKWVTNKALSILNSVQYNEEKLIFKADELARRYLEEHKPDLGFENLEELTKDL